MSIPFKSPATFLIAGPTSSGKSTFIKKLIEQQDEMYENPPEKTLYLYGAWQDGFNSLEKDMNVEFLQGLPEQCDLEKHKTNKKHTIIIIDDLMTSACASNVIHDLFYKNSHHTNTSVILIVQNIFAKHLRGISLNCHYLVIFKSPRDIGQITRLGTQLGVSHLLKEAYLDVCRDQYSYLLIDLHPTTERDYMLRSKIFPGEDTVIYKGESNKN